MNEKKSNNKIKLKKNQREIELNLRRYLKILSNQ